MTNQPYDVMTREEIEASWKKQNQNKEEQKMEQNQTNWMQTELNEANQNISPIGDRKEALKIEDKQMVEVDIDFSKPFDKWIDPNNTKTIRKIIPVRCNGKDMNFWLNPANPIYRELLEAGQKGQTHFKIMRTGVAKATRYVLVH